MLSQATTGATPRFRPQSTDFETPEAEEDEPIRPHPCGTLADWEGFDYSPEDFTPPNKAEEIPSLAAQKPTTNEDQSSAAAQKPATEEDQSSEIKSEKASNSAKNSIQSRASGTKASVDRPQKIAKNPRPEIRRCSPRGPPGNPENSGELAKVMIVWRYYHKDHLGGNTVVTDSLGDVVSTMRFHPYGATAQRTGAKPVYGFAGGEIEEEEVLGLVRFGARWDSAELGRFVTPDPLIGADPGLMVGRVLESGLYGYARNNPVMGKDPSGLAEDEVAGGG